MVIVTFELSGKTDVKHPLNTAGASNTNSSIIDFFMVCPLLPLIVIKMSTENRLWAKQKWYSTHLTRVPLTAKNLYSFEILLFFLYFAKNDIFRPRIIPFKNFVRI